MGNKIARTTQASASEYYLNDLPSSYNLVLKEVLGRGRFFKSILCKHDEGFVLVKVYFKRGDYIDLQEYERRLFRIREIFRNVEHSHVWPFQIWLETDKAAYLLRQYFFNNLLDRLSTRPFLSNIEKKWIAFQLLCAVKQSHECGVCHGDIKCENVVVTSWNWVYLTDFASFKPTYLPDDDPSDFSFFFDTGGRRRCYLAPERFHEPVGDVQYASDAPLAPSMDIFSIGCVLAELFLEGQPLFELSQLLSYRRGQYDPSQLLEKIPDAGIRRMILHMIQLDPQLRLSAESYLQDYTPLVFPTYFSPFLHKFFSCMSPLDSDTRVAVTQGVFNEILKQMLKGNGNRMHNSDSSSGGSLKNVEDGEVYFSGRLDSLLAGVGQNTSPGDDMKKSCKKPSQAINAGLLLKSSSPFRKISKDELNLLVSNYDNDLDTFGISLFTGSENKVSCEGMVLIAALLCSCLRSVKLPQLRRTAILLLRLASLYIDDEERLQHVIPYVIAMLSDSTAIVRCAAIDTLCDVLPLIQDFPPSDAKIFPEYILPMLSTLPDDPEESVRISYASNIYKIALTAYRFLVHSQQLRDVGVLDKESTSKLSAVHLQLSELRKSVAEVVQELVMGPKQTLNIRRALLQDIVYLCCFFGQRQCNDFLLPILPAFLNDRDEQLKALFYDEIVFVCFCVGQRSVEEYLLPYIDQALSETPEPVIVNALECLILLCKNEFLRKSVLLTMMKRAFPLLCHPSGWVRRLAVRLITVSSEKLGPVDSYVYLSPVLRSYLRREPSSLTSEKILLSCLKPPLSRQAFYQELETARSSDMLDRQRKFWYKSSGDSKQLEIDDLNQKSGEGLNAKFGSDDVSKYRSKGSFARISSSGIYIRDPLSSDKLQFSGFISPHVSAGNSLISDGPSEGIPLYSLSVDRRNPGAGTTQSSSLSLWNNVGAGASSMPSTDPSYKSFTMAGSTNPKLVSGSFFSVNNGSKPFKVALDAPVTENDQVDVNKEKMNDMNVSVVAKGINSISVVDSAAFPEVSGVASLSRGAPVPDPGWRPRGVLVAHLQEHRSAVNDIAVSNDHNFFVSASDDSTVKIWDTRKLEKDISFRSRLTYPLNNNRALCATLLRGSSQVVVGSSDGSIHLFSVDYVSKGLGNVVERYSGIADTKKKDVGEGPILSLMNYYSDGIASQSILYSTRNSQIHLWDLRTDSTSWTLKSNPEEGYASSFVTGPCGNWLVSGSSRGILTLWDLRFLIPVNTWQFPVATPVEKMCLFIPLALGPTSSPLRPLIYVAAGSNEISLWNAENGTCYQVLKTSNIAGEKAELNDIPWALARSSAKFSSMQAPKTNINHKYRIDELNDPPSRLPGIRSLLPLPGGDLLSGGTDMRIRRWDHSSPDKSYCVCGPSTEGLGNDQVYETKTSFGVQVVQEVPRKTRANRLTQKAIHTAAATDTAGCHRDSILSVASAKLNQRLLISSSRDGAIKVWK